MRRARWSLVLTVSDSIPRMFAVSSTLASSTSRMMRTMRNAGGKSSIARSNVSRICLRAAECSGVEFVREDNRLIPGERYDRYMSWAIRWPRRKLSRFAILIVSNQRIGHLDNAGRASTTFKYLMVSSTESSECLLDAQT
jgi:hypothetical protein